MNECRIHQPGPEADSDVIDRLRAMPTSVISDSQQRIGGCSGLQPIVPPGSEARMAGVALTVRTRPGDNLVVHQALRRFIPGRVLVIDAGGATDRAILGEIMMAQLRADGAAGVVVDGAVRDRSGLQDLGVPVFAAGVTHCGPYRTGPGEIHGAVSIGGTVVCDGDVIVGDDDGIVVVRNSEAQEVCRRAEARMILEEEAIERAHRGETDYEWLDGNLTIDWISVENGQ